VLALQYASPRALLTTWPKVQLDDLTDGSWRSRSLPSAHAARPREKHDGDEGFGGAYGEMGQEGNDCGHNDSGIAGQEEKGNNRNHGPECC
jgi:hypothetical protein